MWLEKEQKRFLIDEKKKQRNTQRMDYLKSVIETNLQ
jgi:hypothetical protein